MKMHKWSLEAIVLLLATGWLCLSNPTGPYPSFIPPSMTGNNRPSLLPPSLTPESYELSIDPEPSRGVFLGQVVISGVGAAATSRITLHCSHILFNNTQITDTSDGVELEVVGFQEDTVHQRCQLELNTTLKVDHDYRLTIGYVGTIGKDGFGLYRDYYKEGGVRHSIMMTHLQPNFARMVFPCWDEPHYKAQFLIKVRKSHFSTVISNMPANPVSPQSKPPGWVEFEETLPMSPYLVVIVWSNYVPLTDPTSNNSIWAPRARLHEAQLALNISVVVVEQCARYFARDYPLPKLDHIPLPSLSNVAMENWGAITYKQEFLLWEEGVSTWAQKEMTAYVVCHEIVHQWLGNLVTTAWWNTTWLNEGVTSFYHYFFMDKIEPTWNVMDTNFVTQIQMILNEEGEGYPKPLTNNEPMAQDIIVSSAFSATTYLKGAAIIRMVYDLMPPDIFREAIVQYVIDNQFGSVDEEDFWQSIAAVADLPVDLEVVMYSWTHQPGFPLVTVHRSPQGCISVRQEKYLDEDESGFRWTIPLTYTTSDELDYNLTNTVWFPEEKDYLDLEECLDPGDWIIVNIRQSGFYRVNYDLQTWEALTHDLLHCDLSNIHPVNRAQLLNDGFDLAKHGLLDYRVILNLSRYLRRETEPLPWASAIQNFITLRLHFYNTEIFPYFQRYVVNLVDGMFDSMSLTADLGDLLAESHRRQIVLFACEVGHPRCVKEATVTTYLLMSGVHVRVPLDLEPILLCTAVRHGQDEVWHYVLKKYLSAADNERWKYLGALACTRYPDIVDRLLKGLVKPTFINDDDKVNLLVEMGKQDDNLGPMLDIILDKFQMLTSSFDFEVILDVLKTFLKPYMSSDDKLKIKGLADLVNKRKVPKELVLMKEILEEIHSEDYKGLKEDLVRDWFIQEVDGKREKPTLTTVPPSIKDHIDNEHGSFDEDTDEDEDEDEDYLDLTTNPPLADSSSTLRVANVILTTFIILYLILI